MSLLNLEGNDDLSIVYLYYLLNGWNDIRGPFPPVPRLTPLTLEEFAIIAEPTTTFLLNEYQHPRAYYTNLPVPTMNEVAAPITLTHGFYNETPDIQPISGFTNTEAPQNGLVLSTQPQSNGKKADGATENGEEEIKSSKNKKKPRPRNDRMWKCGRCDRKEMELTRAKYHVSKKHAGLSFKDIMVEQPKKLRKSSVV